MWNHVKPTGNMLALCESTLTFQFLQKYRIPLFRLFARLRRAFSVPGRAYGTHFLPLCAPAARHSPFLVVFPFLRLRRAMDHLKTKMARLRRAVRLFYFISFIAPYCLLISITILFLELIFLFTPWNIWIN